MTMVLLILKVIILVAALPGVVPVLVWLERKLMADMQVRIGPNRCGPFGILQPLADALKLFLKEDLTPSHADKLVFTLAPLLSLGPALMTFAAIPFGPEVTFFGTKIPLHIAADVNVGLLYILAWGSLSVYALVLAGWSSNNKYSLLGGLRSSAQMISYELTMGFAVIGIVMWTGQTNMSEIVKQQGGPEQGWFFQNWNFFQFPLMFSFILFFLSGFAETNRAPFDLPEAESELVAGFHTEYSSMNFAIFFMSEYMHMVTISAMTTTLFFGGYNGPWIEDFPILGPVWFGAKTFAFLYFYIWARASWPRIRYDQLMRLGWKFTLEAAIALIIVLAVVMGLGLSPEANGQLNIAGTALFFGLIAMAAFPRKSTKGKRIVRLTEGRTPVG